MIFFYFTSIRSLNKNFENLKELISQLDKSPEIIALSETRLKTDNAHHFKGYTFLHTNSATNAGGVGAYYGAPCVKLRNIKFCIIFWLNYVQYHILLQFMYIAAICVKLLQFMYIAAICVNCCNLRKLQKKNFKSAFNCHGDMLTKTVSVALSLFPWTRVVYWREALLYWLCSVRLLVWLKHLSYWLNESFKLLLLSYWFRYPLEYQQLD